MCEQKCFILLVISMNLDILPLKTGAAKKDAGGWRGSRRGGAGPHVLGVPPSASPPPVLLKTKLFKN